MRKIISLFFIILAVCLGIIFYLKINHPQDISGYFKLEYYNQFGPLAICIELLIAGIYMFYKHDKTNFALALFAFTALLDPLFNFTVLFTSLVPTYAMILFGIAAIVSLRIAFTNTFQTGRISFLVAFFSFVLGSAIELFFNYL